MKALFQVAVFGKKSEPALKVVDLLALLDRNLPFHFLELSSPVAPQRKVTKISVERYMECLGLGRT